MGNPAARLGDMHTCPMVTGMVPHVGGPVSGPGVPTVLIGGMPAAVAGDMCVCAGPPDVIAKGSSGVMIGGKPAARMGDQTAHGGVIVVGCPTVLIGEVGNVTILTKWQKENKEINEAALSEAKKMLQGKKGELERWNESDKANVKKWMGEDTEDVRDMLKTRIDKELTLIDNLDFSNFKEGVKDESDTDDTWNGTFAYVYPDDKDHNIHIGPAYENAKVTGVDSKADTLIHEMSHFNDIGATQDYSNGGKTFYGVRNCQILAKTNPAMAQTNADNFSYYMSH